MRKDDPKGHPRSLYVENMNYQRHSVVFMQWHCLVLI